MYFACQEEQILRSAPEGSDSLRPRRSRSLLQTRRDPHRTLSGFRVLPALLMNSRHDEGIVVERLLNVHEAATLLGLSPRTLYNLAARHQIPVQRVRRRVMFRPSSLEKWLEPQREPDQLSTRRSAPKDRGNQ